jgi:uncharacterized Zn finger protein
MSSWGSFKPYVSVAERRRQAEISVEKLRKKGRKIVPFERPGRAIVTSFWGKAWCKHLEALGDYANRLPRGRTYVRNGSVLHLSITRGRIEALVQGSSLYDVVIKVSAVDRKKWRSIQERCAGDVGSSLELLQGKISSSVMSVITGSHAGLFPHSCELDLGCSCPDSVRLCKHLAAVLYGVGTLLDREPELLFRLRHVDHAELVKGAATSLAGKPAAVAPEIADQDLSALFGIELEAEPEVKAPARKGRKSKATRSR